jgi:hypothetical protein
MLPIYSLPPLLPRVRPAEDADLWAVQEVAKNSNIYQLLY